MAFSFPTYQKGPRNMSEPSLLCVTVKAFHHLFPASLLRLTCDHCPPPHPCYPNLSQNQSCAVPLMGVHSHLWLPDKLLFILQHSISTSFFDVPKSVGDSQLWGPHCLVLHGFHAHPPVLHVMVNGCISIWTWAPLFYVPVFLEANSTSINIWSVMKGKNC